MTVYMTGNHIIQSRTVAPHVGAWIETIECVRSHHDVVSLPMWERGLKLLISVS